MKIYLLRHGETEYNAQQRYLGRTDLPLSESGRAELVPADVCPEAVYVSPMRRAAETAGILFPDARQIVVSELREMDFGVFEGKSHRDMEEFPAYREWVDGGCLGQIPEGESKAAFASRTCAAFQALVDQSLEAGSELLAVVAHGGTQMAVMERFVLPHKDFFSWCGPLGGGYVLDAGRWRRERILTLSDTVRYTRGES